MFQRKMSLKRALLCKKHPASHFLSKTVKDFSCSMKTASSSTCKELSNQYLEDNQTEDRENNDDLWSKLPQELLGEIIQRIESSEDRWPMRKNVVTCACVNKKWREVTQAIVKSANRREDITFPSSLKEPCPRNMPLRCLIRRNKKDSTFYLHLGLNNSLTEMGKFLLAARRFRHGARVEYIISLSADHLSQASNACIGKLTSNFLGTKFTVYDTQPPHHGAKPSLNRASRRLASKQISPQVPASSFEVAQVSYKFNLLKSRGPRRMLCTFQCPCPVMRRESVETSKDTDPRTFKNVRSAVLVNKSPRWHENLQCWCLNFHGRVTVASVKNFQLVARIDPSQPGKIGDEDLVLLQFGKVGDDLFTMDYRQPLSAFQAFAICLTSFGAKIGCE